MNLADEFDRLIGALESGGAEYALAGGLALAVWGAPRATSHIDLLVRPEDLASLLEAKTGLDATAIARRIRMASELRDLCLRLARRVPGAGPGS